MASVFLSYGRDDAVRAEALAKALQRRGHDVWWDRHIHGGSRFTREIDEALKKAEAVLVLWSQASVESAWVQDEAAEGRDSGRLVPVALDECKPPLGFRQYQSIDLSRWNGRANAPVLGALDEAISALSPDGGAIRDAKPPQSRRKGRFSLVHAAIAAAILIAIGALTWQFLHRGWPGQRAMPTIAVLPFSDLSPNADKAYFAEGLAEAILNILAKESGIRVLGRSTAQQLHDAGENSQKMRRSLGITHVLEGSARSAGDELRMSVRLIDAADGRQLWAEEYQRRLDNVFVVQDEIGRAVAQRLKGSFAQLEERAQQETAPGTYALYLAARAKMRDRRMASLNEARKIARQVVEADPNYAPGHALFAELIWHLSLDMYGNLPLDRARELARPYAKRAVALAPNAAEGHAALGVISSGQTAITELATAVRLDPARAEVRLWLARAQQRLGENHSALQQLKAAVDMDPLWAPAVWNYAWALAASARFEHAEAVIAQFERHGGSPAMAARIRADIAGWYRGDYSEAVRLSLQALKLDPHTPLVRHHLALHYNMVAMPKEAAQLAGSWPLYSQLWFSGQSQRLLARVAEDGGNVWKQPDVDIAIRALSERRDWNAVARLVDANRDGPQWACGNQNPQRMQLGIWLATAMKAVGRKKEADRLIDCVKRSLSIQGRGSVRSFAVTAAALSVSSAQVHAIQGQAEQAFPLLEKAISLGFRTRYGQGLAELPAFDAYRSSPGYRQIDAKLKQLIAAERTEVLVRQGAAGAG